MNDCRNLKPGTVGGQPCWRLAALLVFALAAASAWGCSVPVFRYALERWPSDPYGVVVFHKGDLTEAQKALVEKMQPDVFGPGNHANLVVKEINLDEPQDALLQKFWEEHKSEDLPWVIAFYPPQTRIVEPAWAGPLNETTVKTLVDSPARREVARRLLQGSSTLWVFLETGDKSRDDEAFDRLSKEIAHQATALQLPEIAAEDVEAGFLSVPKESLKIAFNAMRLSRKDPAEGPFIDMLLGIEDDLRELNEPMAFPVFGRGRVLYALVGSGINAENIEEASTFLTGPCSCQVKEQNPGADLLMSVSWDDLVLPSVDVEKELPPLSGFLEPEPESAPSASPAQAVPASEEDNESSTVAEPFPVTPGTSAPAPAPVPSSNLQSSVLRVLAGLALIAGFATFLLLKNPR